MPCAAPVTTATFSASLMQRRYHLTEKAVNDRRLSEMLLAFRASLELVLQRLERDGPVAVQARRDGCDRPVDLDLTRVVDAVCWRRRPVGVGRVDRRIEWRKRVERAVGHHHNALLVRTPA